MKIKTEADLRKAIAAILPNAWFDEDIMDGEITVCTGLKFDTDGTTIMEIEPDGTLTHCGRLVEWQDCECGTVTCCQAVCKKCQAVMPDCTDKWTVKNQ